ncbi:hypothetical protein IKP85_07125 [bacterium]|nr:hypothetical protein [bacterium]
MKKLLAVSVLFSLIIGSVAYADSQYSVRNEDQNNTQSNYSDRIDTNRSLWDQTVRSYEVNYNDSMRRYWDAYTEAYQKQKRIPH